MKKTLFAMFAGALVVLAVLGVAGLVSAQTPVPPTSDDTTPLGCGSYGRGGMMNGVTDGILCQAGGTGIFHDAMLKAFADKLGLSVAELEAQIASGKTLSAIAQEAGLTVDEFRTLMLDTRSAAIDQALADGTITAEQAELLKAHTGRMFGAGAGNNGNCPMLDGDENDAYGGMHGRGGMMGGNRWNTQP
jgi:hypothetical protein